MAVLDAVVIAVVGIIVLEGIWLATLTYLMWRAAKERRRKDASEEEADESA